MSRFGEMVRRKRRARGWRSQADLVAHMGDFAVTQQEVSRVENGAAPGLDFVLGLSVAFQESVDALLQEGGYMDPAATLRELSAGQQPGFAEFVDELLRTSAGLSAQDRDALLSHARLLTERQATRRAEDQPRQPKPADSTQPA